MSATRLTKLPPDGGWGWLVVLGSSIVNMFTRAIEPSFGLLFKDLLTELKMETTGAAVVMGTMDSIINFSGLFVGPLMKAMSYRKVALLGAALTATAYLLTVTANSMPHLIASFSIIGGMGFGFANASTFVGLNSYFDKRKAQAVGLAMAGTAAGFMIMPQIVSYLLIHYQFRGTLVIMTALSLNTFVGASLFQPVKWHMKTVETKAEKEEKALLADHVIREEDEEEEGKLQKVVSEENERKKGLATSVSSLPKPTLSLTHVNSLNQVNSLNPASSINAIRRQTSLVASLKPLEQRKLSQVASSASLRRRPSMMSHVSLLDFAGSTMHIDYQDDNDDGLEMKISDKPNETATKKGPGVFSRIAKIMDLNLLKDAVYLNILYGSSISYVSEFGWKLILPFFMYDLGYDLQQTATALSVMSIADIVARVVMPPLLDRLPYSRRATTTVFLVCLAIARSSVAMQTEVVPLMIALMVHAFIRGVTLIGFPLVLSEYATKDNFPAVLGLSMVAKGIFIAVIAPIIGWVRDYSGSYAFSIHFQSMMIISCVTAWTIEYVVVKKKTDDDSTR